MDHCSCWRFELLVYCWVDWSVQLQFVCKVISNLFCKINSMVRKVLYLHTKYVREEANVLILNKVQVHLTCTLVKYLNKCNKLYYTVPINALIQWAKIYVSNQTKVPFAWWKKTNFPYKGWYSSAVQISVKQSTYVDSVSCECSMNLRWAVYI